MSFMEQEKHLPDISETKSLYKDYFRIPIIDSDGSLLNGEKQLANGTIIRCVDGFIDGNIYDSRGEVLYTYPAIEHELGKEYWTKGLPHGFPAISLNLGTYEEYWADGRIIKIKEQVEFLGFSFGDDDDFDEDFEDDESYSDKNTFFDSEYYNSTIEDISDFKKKHEISFDDFSIKVDDSHDDIIDEILSYEKSISIQERLFEIMQIKNLTDTKVYKPIFMSEKAFNRIKNGTPYDSISLNNAIMVAFSLNLTFEQMVKFTNFAGKGFRNYGTRDKIIKKYFDNRNYKIFELNTDLVKAEQEPFFASREDRGIKR